VKHHTYRQILKAINSGKLKEPFTIPELKKACPHLNERTCSNFPSKHRKNNPGGDSELFIQLEDGRYKLIRPFKYGF